MSFSTIPGYLWPSDACKGKVDPATGNTLYNHYCYEESAQIGFALSTGNSLTGYLSPSKVILSGM